MGRIGYASYGPHRLGAQAEPTAPQDSGVNMLRRPCTAELGQVAREDHHGPTGLDRPSREFPGSSGLDVGPQGAEQVKQGLCPAGAVSMTTRASVVQCLAGDDAGDRPGPVL